jgi:integrase/recombinase XerD
VRQLLSKHIATAAASCPSLKDKPVSPHTLRHTNAMLLRAGNTDIATIALWLGHESIKTTYTYQHADPALKERAVASITPLGAKPGRYRPTDALLARSSKASDYVLRLITLNRAQQGKRNPQSIHST